jgi:hypothetical protein
MVKHSPILSIIVWGVGLAMVACDDATVVPRECSDGGPGDELIGECGVESTGPSECVEARVEGELSAGLMPSRPLWVDGVGLHVAYGDRLRGIVRETLSPTTGQALASEADLLCPDYCSLRALARNLLGGFAVSAKRSSKGVFSEATFLQAGDGTKTLWQQPWSGQYNTLAFGWDGEGFTASLLDGTVIWGTARFTPKGEMLANAREFGHAAVNFGQYDVETDPEKGTTVFVTGFSSGVVVAGRYGRDASLTAPDPYWVIGNGIDDAPASTPAVALHGDSALIVWSDVNRGMIAREVSLPDGQASRPWIIATDQDNLFQQIATAWWADHWVVAGQDYRGLVIAELGAEDVTQRRVLQHTPASCAESNSCPAGNSDWRWRANHLSLVAEGGSAWVGFVDMSVHRVENDLAIFTYRMLPVLEGCTFRSLASQ